MKLPEISGRHKIRDAKICHLWMEELMSTEDIGEKFELTARRVNQILYTNASFLELNRLHEKNKRVRDLKKWITKAEEPKSNKLSLQQELRTELEGNGTQINITKNEKNITVYLPGKAKSGNRLEAIPSTGDISSE